MNSAIVGERPLLVAVPSEHREDMRWVADNTPKSAQFLVITAEAWALDRVSEWFPVLANRASVATVQGHEWTGAFTRRMAEFYAVQACADSDADCLEVWAQSTGLTFTHVYVAKKPGGDDPGRTLRSSLEQDPRYVLEHDGPGATIFRRQAQAPPDTCEGW